ncbi:hypothetical protein [Promicromonospora sp. NPDC059942]|uniref:hypothetical protein n=1 Tax=Promicromonospora sp. NPDC059942 TaxID=3347009 RepID=UPI00365AB982
MAHTGPDDQGGDDAGPTSTAGWSWGAGVAVGLCIGVALGLALDNLAIGIALGAAFVPVFAMMRGTTPSDDAAPGSTAPDDDEKIG